MRLAAEFLYDFFIVHETCALYALHRVSTSPSGVPGHLVDTIIGCVHGSSPSYAKSRQGRKLVEEVEKVDAYS